MTHSSNEWQCAAVCTGPTQYEKFRTDNAGFYGSLAAMSKDEERMAAMGFIKKLVDLQLSGEVNFGACIRLAFEQLVATFRDAILAVVNAGDVEEARTKEPYWTGTKRKPNPVEFSLANPMAVEYLYTVRARPGRLSALGVSHSKSVFVWGFCVGVQGA